MALNKRQGAGINNFTNFYKGLISSKTAQTIASTSVSLKARRYISLFMLMTD